MWKRNVLRQASGNFLKLVHELKFRVSYLESLRNFLLGVFNGLRIMYRYSWNEFQNNLCGYKYGLGVIFA